MIIFISYSETRETFKLITTKLQVLKPPISKTKILQGCVSETKTLYNIHILC